MRFPFTTIQFEESAFYGRVAGALAARGHQPAHLTIPRLAARTDAAAGREPALA